MDRGEFVKTINLTWSKVQIMLTSHGLMVAVHLVASNEEPFNNYQDASYEDISAKDHEWTRRASKVVIDYDLSITSHLLTDAIMNSKSNNRNAG